MTAEAVLEMPEEAMPEKPLLEVVRLRKQFPVKTGMFKKAAVSAVDDVSFDVHRGTTVGIVGESGCGKSTTARLILGLIEPDGGDVIFERRNLGNLQGAARKAITRQMQMVFQDP